GQFLRCTQHHGDIETERIGDALLDGGRRCRRLGGVEHDVAALDVREDAGVAEVFEQLAQLLHRHLAAASDIDAAQQCDMGAHESRYSHSCASKTSSTKRTGCGSSGTWPSTTARRGSGPPSSSPTRDRVSTTTPRGRPSAWPSSATSPSPSTTTVTASRCRWTR